MTTRRHLTALLALGLLFGGCGPERTATQPSEIRIDTEQGRPDTDGSREGPPAVQAAAESSPASSDPALAPTTPSQTTPSQTTPTRKTDGRLVDCTFDDIKFPLEKGDPFDRSLLTDRIEDLVGRRIRIRGFILPGFQQTGLTQFVLVRDNMECCFGPGAALYDCIVVEMDAGKTTEFSTRPVAVEGTFSIKELIGPDGSHLAIYHVLGNSVTR
jgi:hypothetical protein